MWARRLSRTAAKGDSFEAATSYASEKLGQDIRAAVLKDAQELAKELKLEQLETFWVARSRRRYDHASYGMGTWLLGEDRALAGTSNQNAKQPSKGGGEKDAERAALEQKIKRFLENQKRAVALAAVLKRRTLSKVVGRSCRGRPEVSGSWPTTSSSAVTMSWVRDRTCVSVHHAVVAV